MVTPATLRSYLNPLTGSNSISTFREYDHYGNVIETTDAKGNITEITYGNVSGPNGNVTGLRKSGVTSAILRY